MIKNKKLIIVGDSSFAEIAYEYFSHDSAYEVVSFCVEKSHLSKTSLFNLPVISFETLTSIYPPENFDIFVAIPYAELNQLRSRLMNEAKNKGYTLASYISSKAFVWQNVKIGEHCFIFENNTIQPFVEIKKNVVLWSGNHVGHHSIIENNCFISSHVVISGHCHIKRNSFLGVNSTIANNVTIGEYNWLSPNVTIMRNTPDESLFKTNTTKPYEINTLSFFKVNKQ